MTIEQVDEWLLRAWEIDKEIEALLDSKQKMLDRCLSVTSTTKDVCVQSGNTRTDDALAAYITYKDAADEATDRLVKVKCEVLAVINRIENSSYRTLLIEHYINFKTWEEIAFKQNYSWRHTMRRRKTCLLKIKDVIECHRIMC